MASQVSVSEYARAINASWQKTTDGILETARLCAEADKKLEAKKKKDLIEKLYFSSATFSKLVTIGQTSQLQPPEVKSLLPPNYTIVYQVAKLSADELGTAIEAGIITPKMSRADLNAWVAERGGRDDGTKVKPRVFATLQVAADFDSQKERELEQALQKLQKDYGFTVVHPRDPEKDEIKRTTDKVDDLVRNGARRHIGLLKTQRLAAGGRHPTPAIRKRLWSYSEDAIEIPDDATWEQVQRVLETVGSGDQFERLVDEALRLCGVSQSFLKEHPTINHEEAVKEVRENLRLRKREIGLTSASAGQQVH